MSINKNSYLNKFLKTIVGFLIVFCFIPGVNGQDTNNINNDHILKIRGGYNDPPFEFLENGIPTGFNVDLMKEVSKIMGLEIEILLEPWHSVRTKLETGKIDAVTGMYYSVERDKLVDFSSPYIHITSDIFVRKGSSIKSLEDLKNKEIIIEQDGLMHDFLKSQNITTKFIPVADVYEALELLASGKHDCTILSKMQGLYFIEKFNLSGLKSVGSKLPFVQNCFAVSEGNILLLDKLNEGLHILRTTGKYKEIHDKWFGVYTKTVLWDNLKYFVYVIIIIAIILIGILSWNYFLRQHVKKQTAELRQIIDLVPHMIFAKDITGRYILVNKSFAEFYKMPTEQMIGKNESEINSNQETSKFLKEDLDVIKRNKLKFTINRVMFPESEDEHIVETTKIPFTSSQTDHPAVLGIAIDVTNRKKQEEAIMESRRRYLSIFQTAAVSIWEDDIYDLKCMINKFKSENKGSFRDFINKDPEILHNILTSIKMINVNEETLKLFKAKNKKELLKSLQKTITPGTLLVYKEAIIAIAEGQIHFESEIPFQTLTGDFIHALLKITIPPLHSKSNRLILSMMDITRLKEVESEIRKLNEELEERVKDRTLQLQETNKSLEKALKKLEEDEEAGKEIQEQLLPEPMKIFHGYEFSNVFMPSMYLSGDFIDYFEIDKDYLGFYMADVSGHGISSAFITVFLKSFFSQCVKMYHSENDITILNPDLLLKELNNEIIDKNLSKYLTIFYGVIDIEDKKLIYCNGGQFPFPILLNENKVTFLQNKSMPVGLYDFAKYKINKIPIKSPFSLLLISDGILEVLAHDSLVEKEKFLLSLLKNQETTVQTILKDLSFINNKDLPDDITFCLLRRIL